MQWITRSAEVNFRMEISYDQLPPNGHLPVFNVRHIQQSQELLRENVIRVLSAPEQILRDTVKECELDDNSAFISSSLTDIKPLCPQSCSK